MSDTSLPNRQSTAQNSYVDSYVPPTQGGVIPTPPATPVTAQASATSPTPTPAPVPKTSDPLAELEKALQEYEAKQQAAAKSQAVTQKVTTPASSGAQPDPLAELERVLDEYDRKYKQQPATTTPTTAQKDDNVMTADEFKQLLQNPNPPPTATPVTMTEPTKPAVAADQEKQAIEEQNIFELLGVMDAADSEKEAFLDELQQALWEDFLDKDLALLVNADQLKEVQTLRNNLNLTEPARQEQLIQKVEQLVPDVEEIMLEKALELKEDMVKERLAGMKEYYATKPAEMAKIQEAQQHILAGRWKSGTQLLNTLTA